MKYICDQPGLLAGLFVPAHLIPLQLPFSPLRVFAGRIEYPLDVSVQRPQHADARHHGRAVELGDQEQGFYRGLPLVEILLGLGKLLNIVGGVL